MIFKRIDHVEIIPKDTEGSVNFYRDVLGFKMKNRTKIGLGALEEVIFLELGDTMLEIVSMTNPTVLSGENPVVGYRMMAIEVASMDEAVAYLKTKGVEMSLGPMTLPDGSKRGEIKDPDGLGIELRQW
jgi:catechol 2,3-dioxygenase-like lactoylglutathione lyase family enzyme